MSKKNELCCHNGEVIKRAREAYKKKLQQEALSKQESELGQEATSDIGNGEVAKKVAKEKLQQKELRKKDCELTQETISKIETEQRLLSLKEAFCCAGALDIFLSDLIKPEILELANLEVKIISIEYEKTGEYFLNHEKFGRFSIFSHFPSAIYDIDFKDDNDNPIAKLRKKRFNLFKNNESETKEYYTIHSL